MIFLIMPLMNWSLFHVCTESLSSHKHCACDTCIQPFSHTHMQTSINLTQFKTFLSSDCSLVQVTKSTRCVSFRVLGIGITWFMHSNLDVTACVSTLQQEVVSRKMTRNHQTGFIALEDINKLCHWHSDSFLESRLVARDPAIAIGGGIVKQCTWRYRYSVCYAIRV